MKYVSIDIETAGLDEKKHPILEIGAVMDDLAALKNVMELPTFRLLIYQDEYNLTPYCALMHQKLLQEIEQRKEESIDKSSDEFLRAETLMACRNFDMLTRHKGLATIFLKYWINYNLGVARDMPLKINAAGKNFSRFDLRFLDAMPYAMSENVQIRHRVIDVAGHFYQPGDECLPDTATCIRRAGLTTQAELAHTALADARNVCRLVRKVLAVPFAEIGPDAATLKLCS